MHEVLDRLALPDAGYERFGLRKDAADVGVVGLEGHLGDLLGDLNEAAVDGVTLDEPSAGLGNHGGGEVGDQLAEVGGAADLLQAAAP